MEIERLSMNKIRSEFILDNVSFHFVYWCSLYIRHFCYVVSLLLVSVCLMQTLNFHNIYLSLKKNTFIKKNSLIKLQFYLNLSVLG
jgi:hypothetical protein